MKRPAGPGFNRPTGVAVNDAGDIFVSDGYRNCRVHRYSADGSLVTSWGSPGTVNPGDFNLPHGIALDNEGRVLVCDRENHRIQIFHHQEGEYLAMWTGFRQPCDVAVGPDGEAYVAELQPRLSIVDPQGNVLSRWGGETSHEPGQFVAPHGGSPSTLPMAWRYLHRRGARGQASPEVRQEKVEAICRWR